MNETKPASIRVLMAEDHPVVADGIAAILATARDMVLVGRAANGMEAIELLKRHEPDIALLDLRLPVMDGLEVARWIKSSGLRIRTIFLTFSHCENDQSEAIRAGARAYLVKDTPPAGILGSIRRVHREKVSPFRGALLANAPTGHAARFRVDELKMLKLILHGDDNQTIGAKLGLQPNAVKYLLRRLYSKLGVKKRGAAAREAIERGLIPTDGGCC